MRNESAQYSLKPVKTAVIGCGMISGIYLKNALTWDILDVVACSDVVMERAKSQAEKFHIPQALSVADLLADPSIELVINLTVPSAHGEVGLKALRAGKSVYNEKPLAVTREEAQQMLREANSRGLLVGCAPDTFLGGGLQTCRKLIDDGAIGQPVAASASFQWRGPEHIHPDPEFFFKAGAGPLFDMGPYYLTALISMLGPVRSVGGSARITFPTRTIQTEPLRGKKILVETPTHIASVIDFVEGPIVTLVTSFDIWDKYLPSIEIYGTNGRLRVPDPNRFGGTVRLWCAGKDEGYEVPLTHGHTENSRCIGVADMAYAMRTGRPHRASGGMAFHVLDVMHGILEAAASGHRINISSTCERPAPLPEGLPERRLDT